MSARMSLSTPPSPVVAVCLAFAVAACGHSAPPPPAQETQSAPPGPEESKGPKLFVQQELGDLDQGEAERAFEKLRGPIADCHKKGLERVEFEDGDVNFFLRIGQDGRAKWAVVEDSTLGDQTTEKCMVDALMRADWPKPRGGEAQARKSWGFDPPGRRAATWSPDKLSQLLGKNPDLAGKCKSGGKVKITLYVGPDGKGGKILAAGGAAPKERAEALDCILDAVKTWKQLPSPGSYGAKVSFFI
jgi:hypothetical protein